MLEEIGKIIREQRKSLGYSIEQLAEYSETSFSTISRIELGKIKDIHLSTLNRILNALNLNLTISSKNNANSKNVNKLIRYIYSLPTESQDEISELLLRLLSLNTVQDK